MIAIMSTYLKPIQTLGKKLYVYTWYMPMYLKAKGRRSRRRKNVNNIRVNREAFRLIGQIRSLNDYNIHEVSRGSEATFGSDMYACQYGVKFVSS